MRFWDASAIIPLLLDEEFTAALKGQYQSDPELIVWWATDVECVSAVARRERDGGLSGDSAAAAISRLEHLGASWLEVAPAPPIRRLAIRLLRVHALRAADALQLAAAVVASESDPRTLPLVTLDDRLALAATREGFPVTRPATG
jgi:predicted nucleic acid-binding protein